VRENDDGVVALARLAECGVGRSRDAGVCGGTWAGGEINGGVSVPRGAVWSGVLEEVMGRGGEAVRRRGIVRAVVAMAARQKMRTRAGREGGRGGSSAGAVRVGRGV